MHRLTVARGAAALVLSLATLAAFASPPERIAPRVATPLANTGEIVGRLFSPLEALALRTRLLARGLLDAPAIDDLAAERLLVRIPKTPGPDGRYGVLVFLGPWEQARLHDEWDTALDAHGVVFVGIDAAGDASDPLGRRGPLALLAQAHAASLVAVDPDRVYVTGYGTGSKVAQRLAFAYPEVFAGLVSNGGALPLGTQELPLPARASLERLRTRTRLVFATGNADAAFAEQQQTLKSLRDACIPVAEVFELTGMPRAPLSGRLLDHALRELEGPMKPVDPACVAAQASRAHDSLAAVAALADAGEAQRAREALVEFDHHYGALLPDDEMQVARRVNPAYFAPAAH